MPGWARKTTLVQALLAEVDPGNVECVLVSHPTLSSDEFYEFLAAQFGLSAAAATSKTQFLFELRQQLTERRAAGKISAILVDEAQCMSHELLEEVRLLSNCETPTEKLLNVVLSGQPEMAQRLNEPELRQLKQRVSLRCELKPFDFHDTASYIAGRLRIAGGEPGRIFTREAVLAIHDAARGIPRTVNVVCDNALIAGFAAEERPVTKARVDEVCRDFDLGRSRGGVEVAQAPVDAERLAGFRTSPSASSSPSGEPADQLAPELFTGLRKRRSFFSSSWFL